MVKKQTKKKQKNALILLILILLSMAIAYYIYPKEVKFEDVSFKMALQNYTNLSALNTSTQDVWAGNNPADTTRIWDDTSESSPYELYFSIVNPNFKQVNCTATLTLIPNNGTIIKKNYLLGNISQRTKLKYKIPFDMPLGNTSINLFENCHII